MLLLAAVAVWPQARTKQDEMVRLPDGRNQQEEILKADHQKSLKDADELVKLTGDLKTELEKYDRHVLSLSALKRLDEIEKIARRIRSRYKRY